MRAEDEEFLSVMATYLAEGKPIEQLRKLHIVACGIVTTLERGIEVFEAAEERKRKRANSVGSCNSGSSDAQGSPRS